MAEKLLVVRAQGGIWETHTRFPFLADAVVVRWRTLCDHSAIADRFAFVLTPETERPCRTQRWTIEVYGNVRDDAPPLFYREVEIFSRGDNIALRHAVREMPDCFLAISESAYPRFRRACDAEAVAIAETRYAGPIRTGPLPRP